MPELADLIGCQQNHPGHNLDVFSHTEKVIEHLPLDFTLRMTALLHDIGKPQKKVLGEDGFDHFWGHEEVSASMAKDILARLNIDEKQAEVIVALIRLHDTPIAKDSAEMQEAIARHGAKFINNLLILQKADLLAHSDSYCARKMPHLEEINRLFESVVAQADARIRELGREYGIQFGDR